MSHAIFTCFSDSRVKSPFYVAHAKDHSVFNYYSGNFGCFTKKYIN